MIIVFYFAYLHYKLSNRSTIAEKRSLSMGRSFDFCTNHSFPVSSALRLVYVVYIFYTDITEITDNFTSLSEDRLLSLYNYLSLKG